MATILIVDDEKTVIQQISELITTFGHTPQFLLESEYLFQLLETLPVELILLDINMPGVDGLQRLKQLKSDERYTKIPVIMLTGDVNEKLIEDCFESGAADFINKPIREVVLKARIQAALEARHYIDQLQAALREKEVLLKEIHHRVKNNLQIISSLFTLQLQRTENEGLRTILKESQNRVESMALIHEKLYQTKNLAQIDFGTYLQELVADLFHSYRIPHHSVSLELDVQSILLSVDTAIPCSLILNELVSNALKYAFVDGSAGKLRITLHPHENNRAQLCVQDNGVGLPEVLNFQTTKSLGLRLVRILTNQLRGTVDLEVHPGTTFTIVFPID